MQCLPILNSLMHKIRNIIRALTPSFLLDAFRRRKKQKRNRMLDIMRRKGEAITALQIAEVLRKQGLQSGDSVLVHCAMSKIGFLEKGPETLVDALIQVVGDNGHILMPTSPNPAMQLDYIRDLDCFDVLNSPSKMGAVTEYFRKLPGVERSLSPVEPVSVLGPDAEWFISGHTNSETPYNADSPFARLAQRKGKILYLGVTLIQAGTSLHLLEDAVDDFPFPVYYPEKFPVKVRDKNGRIHQWSVKVHNPEVSAQRKCDGLFPLFISKNVAHPFTLGQAPGWLFYADTMLSTMIEAYKERGVTMYTPEGAKN
jgi:aminoglycoside 3-N-acetyltransferase